MTLIGALGPAARTQLSTLIAAASLLVVWASVVIVWPLGPQTEGNFLPVVGKVFVSETVSSKNSVAFYVEFRKLRQCEFIGLTWYRGDVRLILEFEPDADKTIPTRPTGGQYIGPWRLHGTNSLEGTNATVVHRCHPFWNTYTQFYP